MSFSSTLDRFHSQAKQNSWLWLFYVFNRVSLAFGFFVAGMVKVMDERFASGLHDKHPMGHYLEALYHTGYYYTFIGIAQIAAAIFLLIPRTVTLGAFIYFPIILNITVLTYATRFDGSIFTAPLMTLANLFLLGWNYEKWKYILPFNRLENEKQKDFESEIQTSSNQSFVNSLYKRLRTFLKRLLSDKIPTLFFAGVFAVVVIFVLVVPGLFTVKPRNTLTYCVGQFKNTNRTKAGADFCACIHNNGEPLDKCLNDYNNSPNDDLEKP